MKPPSFSVSAAGPRRDFRFMENSGFIKALAQ